MLKRLPTNGTILQKMPKILLCLFLFWNMAFAKTIEDAMEDVLSTKKEMCIHTPKALFQVINKTESLTTNVEIKVDESRKLDNNTEIKVMACCNNSFQSSSYIKMVNLKTKKDIFVGWMFSGFTSLNSPEDSKFDITLLKCL